MDLLQDIHRILKTEGSAAESGPEAIDKLNSLLTSILQLQSQQIDLLQGLSDRVARITQR